MEALADDAGQRLDRVLANHLPDISRSRIGTFIRTGYVTNANGAIEDPSKRVKQGEIYHLSLPPAEPAEPEPQSIPLSIAYEDDALIVIDKPAGLVVHPAPGNKDGTLVNGLLAHCGRSLSGIGGVRRPGIVHRLDKDTSGLLVVAKNDAAHQALSAQFADHGRTGPLERAYLAFVWGKPDKQKGTINKPLGRHPSDRLRQAVLPKGKGREAITHFERVEGFGIQKNGEALASLVRCRLETGRTHQIRVHMAAIGHPLLGDNLYGKSHRTKASRLDDLARNSLEALGRQALHAELLAFAHPDSGELMRFTSKLPADLLNLHTALKKI